ncbi:hypothetical protein NDA12_005673 [Ustilago hordei]|nr:hypothetical protein NDA12_005673 [Ustilago hordei]
MRRPTLHGNEFVSAERILQAALEDGPIVFMLLEEPPSSLPAFGFVPTGADKGVEMEVEVDKVVTAADIPKPYQHLRDVFDEVEADKLPHHTKHDLHLKLIEGVVYLDDFLIFSDTEEAHVKHVTKVLTRLRSNRLFAKLSKCEFHTKTVEFLGYIIKPTGIEMDPEKVHTVKEWPMPESIHDIQRFLGFANFYRRFIAHFARIAKPLTSLVKPIEQFKKFELPEEAQQAFHKLIQAFTSAGVLQHFDYHLPTRLETDASDFAIAGVLKQEHEG